MKRLMVIIIGCVLIALVIFGANYAIEMASATVEQKTTEEKTSAEFIEDKRPEEWETYLFPEDEVIEIKLYIDEDQYDYMVENASSELYVPANIVYNGLTLENIAIRPKGNSSLREAISAGKEQFSFKLKFDEYIYQSLYGITSIGLNNCFSDASYIREITSYEIIEEMGLPVPGTTFCNVYINDELAGLYLSVQQIDEVFTAAWFDDGDGDLFKPEGTGADMVYTDDDYSSYSGLGERSPLDNNGEEDVVAMIKALSTGENLEEVLYVDLVLKFHALNTAMLSLDGYMGGMFHNYYLYGEDGKYMIIPWDYNMSFGGFGMTQDQSDSSDSTETQFYIDEPTSGAVEKYPLISTLLSNEAYLEQYHEYLTELINGPLEIERFTARAEELTALIDEYVKNDPEPMSSYEAFQSALYDTGKTEQFDDVEGTQGQEAVNENSQELEERPEIPAGETAQETEERPEAPARESGQEPGERPEAPAGESDQEPEERPEAPAGENSQEPGEEPQEVANENNQNTEEQNQGFMKERNAGMSSATALVTFVESWTENMSKQLSGELASTNNGEGNQSGMAKEGMAGGDQMPGNMQGGNRPAMGERPMLPPEGMEMGERPMLPPEGMEMGDNFPAPLEGMDGEEMKGQLKNQGGVPGDVQQASVGFVLIGSDFPKYIMIIVAAFFVMLFAWVIKKRN